MVQVPRIRAREPEPGTEANQEPGTWDPEPEALLSPSTAARARGHLARRAAATGSGRAAGRSASVAAPANAKAAGTGHAAASVIGAALPARATLAGLLALRGRHELPLVVVRGAVVHPDGRGRALARDAHDLAAECRAGVARLPRPARRPRAPRLRGWRLHPGNRLAASSRCGLLTGNGLPWGRRRRRCEHGQEVLAGDRILVFLAEELAVHEGVNAGGAAAGTVFTLVEPQRSDVLLAAERQLGFFLTGGLLLPGRQGRSHPNGHDAHANQEHDHNEPGCVRL